eukprot:scaffold23186_cov112-Isochrysis_galbana.AAC.7
MAPSSGLGATGSSSPSLANPPKMPAILPRRSPPGRAAPDGALAGREVRAALRIRLRSTSSSSLLLATRTPRRSRKWTRRRVKERRSRDSNWPGGRGRSDWLGGLARSPRVLERGGARGIKLHWLRASGAQPAGRRPLRTVGVEARQDRLGASQKGNHEALHQSDALVRQPATRFKHKVRVSIASRRGHRALLLVELHPPRAAPEAVSAGVLQVEGGSRLEQVAHAPLVARVRKLRVKHEARPGLAEPRASQAVQQPLQAPSILLKVRAKAISIAAHWPKSDRAGSSRSDSWVSEAGSDRHHCVVALLACVAMPMRCVATPAPVPSMPTASDRARGRLYPQRAATACSRFTVKHGSDRSKLLREFSSGSARLHTCHRILHQDPPAFTPATGYCTQTATG